MRLHLGPGPFETLALFVALCVSPSPSGVPWVRAFRVSRACALSRVSPFRASPFRAFLSRACLFVLSDPCGPWCLYGVWRQPCPLGDSSRFPSRFVSLEFVFLGSSLR